MLLFTLPQSGRPQNKQQTKWCEAGEEAEQWEAENVGMGHLTSKFNWLIKIIELKDRDKTVISCFKHNPCCTSAFYLGTQGGDPCSNRGVMGHGSVPSLPHGALQALLYISTACPYCSQWTEISTAPTLDSTVVTTHPPSLLQTHNQHLHTWQSSVFMFASWCSTESHWFLPTNLSVQMAQNASVAISEEIQNQTPQLM